MGKIKQKIKTTAGDRIGLATTLALDEQIERSTSGNVVRTDSRLKKKTIEKQQKYDKREKFIDGDLSAKILQTARKQKLSEEEEAIDDDDEGDKPSEKRSRANNLGDISDESDDDDDGNSGDDVNYDDNIVNLDQDEEKVLEHFMIRNKQPTQKTLYDIIQEKIAQKQHDDAGSQNGDIQLRQLDPQLVEMYNNVGVVLSRYRSGKIPKAFKIIPKMINWEQILQLTEPDKWTAAAMYQATRLFASNLNAKMCQRFYNLIVLPRLRDDIEEFKKLNFHLYQALHKSLYKPAAFFKGILIPLCESGTCTLREATIFGSVLAKSSIPMLHAAAAMLKIAEMDYNGANSLFLRYLIDKKYTLPYRAIDALVFHFLRFSNDKRQMPVLWHQALLALCQRYKSDISSEQRDSLLELLKVHSHYQITPEIRHELMHAESRDVEENVDEQMDDDEF